MAYSKANLEIGSGKESPCFKQYPDSKISSSEIECVHYTVQSDIPWYKQIIALFTNLFFIRIDVWVRKIFLTVPLFFSLE
jgi:hypothetical protein